MFATILVTLLSASGLHAWSGIVLVGSWAGDKTQLYVPGHTSNVNFGLSHNRGQAGVILNGVAYFTGGYPTNMSEFITNDVRIKTITNTCLKR
jgi:hypothetical protein